MRPTLTIVRSTSLPPADEPPGTPPPGAEAVPKLPGNLTDLPGCSDLLSRLRKSLGDATTAAGRHRAKHAASHFAAAVRRLREMETHAAASAEDAAARVKAADADQVLVIRGWSLTGRWLQRRVRSEGGRGKKGGLYAAAINGAGYSADQADDLRWIGWIPDDELERRIKAGFRSKKKLADIGRKEFDKHGNPTGRSVDGRSVTDDLFTFIKNVERRLGGEVDSIRDVVDLLETRDRPLWSQMSLVLNRIDLATVDGAGGDPRGAVALLRAVHPSYGRMVDFVRLLAGYAEDAISAEAKRATAKP